MTGMVLAERYEIVGEIGRGGMGVVYEARDLVLDRKVAVKVLRSRYEDAEALFRREVRIVAEMDHPGVVPVYDFGRDGGGLFFVMPLVRGATLRARIAPGPLTEPAALSIGAQVADALHYSHARGVVHRDVKPENVMVLEEDAPTLRVKVMDFGVALRLGQEADGAALVGTLSYLAPEQLRGEPCDASTDVYMLGAVLYECLSGEVPFVGDTLGAVYGRVLAREPTPLKTRVPSIGAETHAIVMRCLAKRREARPQSARALADALHEALEGAEPSRWTRRSLSDVRVTLPREELPPAPVVATTQPAPTQGPAANAWRDTLVSHAIAAPLPAPQEGPGAADRLGDLRILHGDYAGAEAALQSARRERPPSSPADEASYLLRRARLAHKLGRYEEARADALRGVAALGERDPLIRAELLAAAALACCASGDHGAAAALIEQGMSSLFDATGAPRAPFERKARRAVEARLLRSLGNLRLGRGKAAAAAAVFEDGLRRCDPAADPWEHSIALFNLGDALRRAGAYDEAEVHLERAYAAKVAIGDRWGIAYTHAARAQIALDRGALDRAAREAGAGLDLALAVGDPKLASQLHEALGRVALAAGRVDDAMARFERAREDAIACRAAPEIAGALNGLSQVHLARGDTARAAAVAREAVAVASSSQAERGAALVTLGAAAALLGHVEEASRCYAEALGILDATGNPHRRAEVYAAMARLRALAT